MRDKPLLDALAAASIRTGTIGNTPTEAAASGLCWALWRTSTSTEALGLLQAWVANASKVDAVLLAHAAMELEWQRTERFLEYQALLLLCWDSLQGCWVRWEAWLQ